MLKPFALLILAGVPFTAFAASGLSVDEYIKLYDKNGDRLLSIQELPLRELFADANGDGVMDHDELSALTRRIMGGKFHWVNELPADHGLDGVQHATFMSPSMGIPVGYCIYLPPAYTVETAERYPVVYYLHGGRPGNETKSVRLAKFIHETMASGKVAPAIYVFVNGGQVSHYNYTGEKNSLAADVFVKELIPHIDATYRTIADRRGRALQGFSQGGRGTTRIMFQYPELFSSAAPGGPAYAVEKKISENAGLEKEDRLPGVAPLQFAPDENAFDRARQYAQTKQPPLDILIWVGTEGFNYEATLEYMGFLYGLGIPFERLVVPDARHNPLEIYEAAGIELMRFHDAHFSRSPKE